MEPLDQPEIIIGLLRKHLDGTLDVQEQETLSAWAAQAPENQALLDRISRADELLGDMRLYRELWNPGSADAREKRILKAVEEKISAIPQLPRGLGLLRGMRISLPWVAALVLCIGLGAYWLLERKEFNQPVEPISAQQVLPGGNRATLSLADGSTIDLNADQSGIIVGEDITYLDGSAITAPQSSAPTEMLRLKTPLGGNYQVVLPDGSRVWLNAGSTLSYPARFADSGRVVQLEGEAYFEVADQRADGKKIPFMVKSKGQSVQVLGTAFNISAYAGEQQIRTTLVEGAIEIMHLGTMRSNRIQPGQQAVLQGGQMQVHQVDVANVVAWKDGRFSFDGKTFDEIMREMARWYKLHVVYQGGIPEDRFIGDAYKTDKLGTVLRFLESSGIQYRVEPDEAGTYKLIIMNTGKGKEAVTRP